VGRQELEPQSGTLQQLRQRRFGTESGRNGLRTLIADVTGYIDDVKPGLPRKRSERLCQGLRRNVRAQGGRLQDNLLVIR